jgi:lambda family phage portal protein
MGLIDRVQRTSARLLLKAGHSLQAAGYRAGSTAPQWSGDWAFGVSSINRTLQSDAVMMRDKARDLVMNNATAARIPTLFQQNVSGKDGILYQAAVMDANGEPDQATNRTLEDGWFRWAEDPRAVTADQRMTWQELEQMTDGAECTDGETLVRLLPGFKNAWRFAVQLLDPDQLDVQYNRDRAPGRNAIVMGVEVDEWGAPVAYHLWPNHPSEHRYGAGTRLRVPASQILHNFITHRPGQQRGATWFAPVIADLMHLGRYREAEVIAARLAAAKMGFIKGGSGASTDEMLEATPGVIPRLGMDEDFVAWDPNHPNGNHAQFETVILQSIASAFGVSFMSLSGNLSGTSFSSGQMGYLAEKSLYQSLQQRRILRYSRPVHHAWLPMALVSGKVDVRGNIDALSASTWRARPFQPIDALKAAKTDAINLALGKTCLTDLVEADGGDLRAVLQKRKAEIELARELGVPLFLPVGSATPVDGAATDDERAPTSDADDEGPFSLSLERVA